MSKVLALQILGVSAFSALVAPAVGFLGFGVFISVKSREPFFPDLKELPGLYVELGPQVVFASVLFSLLVWALTVWRGRRLHRWQVAATGTTAFALVFAAWLVVLRAGSEEGLVAHEVVLTLAAVAGAVSGLAVPRRLLPSVIRA